MKWNGLSVPKWSPFVTFVVTTAIFGFSCGSGSNSPPPTAVVPQNPGSFADTVCGDPIFGMGRPVSMSALASVGRMGFTLREVHFRNVVLRNPNTIEFAYRTKVRLVEKANPVNPLEHHLEPEFAMTCNIANHPSPRALQISRARIPILSDLHLPSLRIAASTEQYSVPRTAEMTVSLDNRYFSFNSFNANRFAGIRTIGQYVDFLKFRTRHDIGRVIFDVVEVREMAEGWIGIVAEKYSGVERSQLLILLSRSY